MKRDYVTSTTRENMYQNNITYRRNIDHTSFVLRGVFGVGLTGCEINEGGVIPMAGRILDCGGHGLEWYAFG
jgi:hypothetical protein